MATQREYTFRKDIRTLNFGSPFFCGRDRSFIVPIGLLFNTCKPPSNLPGS